jgi:RimJ/RimL family protein N-acetyltransferase
VPAFPLPDPPLTDGHIVLRPFDEADVPAIVLACQDPLSQRFLVDLPWPYEAAQARSWLASHTPNRQAGHSLDLAICSADGHLLGAIGAGPVSRRTVNVGYWLTPEARGHGHASAALRLVISWLFTALEVERVELTTAPDNLGSQRVAVACGFRQEGYLRQHLRFLRNGERRDSLLFGLLREDLRADRAPGPRVVWLNGTFGAGKSSAAAELGRRHPELTRFDPEYIGFVLREFVPVPTGDFQDLPEWREVVAATLLSLSRHRTGPVLAPMSLLRRDYLLEVFTALRAGGVAVRHVLIDAPDAVLRARIDGDAESDSALAFRHGKLEVYREVREWLRLSADLVIDSAEMTVAEVADQIEPLVSVGT